MCEFDRSCSCLFVSYALVVEPALSLPPHLHTPNVAGARSLGLRDTCPSATLLRCCTAYCLPALEPDPASVNGTIVLQDMDNSGTLDTAEVYCGVLLLYTQVS